MPNLTSREMLARLPVRMADGGDAAGVSAAYREAMAKGGQQTVNDYYANLRAEGEKYLANPNAPTGPEAYNVLLQSGISTSDLINAGVNRAVLDKIFTVQQPAGQLTATGQVIPAQAPAMQFTTPAGLTSAYERSPDLMNEMARLSGGNLPMAIGYDSPRAILDKQGRQYVENLQQGGIDAAERAQMLEYATERGYTFDDLRNAGVDPSLLFNMVTPPPKAYVPPVVKSSVFPQTQTTYTAPTVYQPLPSQPDIYAAGQPALDTAFRESAPRTAILDKDGRPTGQFDYTPAAKLRPATGAGFTFTPPSVTSRPRSLLSPREIAAYGGLTSKSQQFAANRALIDRNLRTLLGSTPALTNTSTYNLLRNRVMSGEFGADPTRVFNPATEEGQRFQAYLATLPAAAPAPASVRAPAATGTVADLAETGQATTAGTTVAGGYAAPIEASPLDYGGYREFNQGGAVKKPEGFAEGGIATSGRIPLDPSDPRYITEDPRVSPDVQVPLDELLRRQMAASPRPTAPSPRMARAAQQAAQPQTESASMLSNLLAGAAQIPGTVYDYGKGIAQSERPLAAFGEDVSTLAGGMYEGLKQDPIGFGLDMTPIIGEIRSGMDAKKYSDMANEAQAAGDTALADTYRQVATMAAAGAVPFGGIGARGARRAAISDMDDVPPDDVPPDSARGMMDALTPETGIDGPRTLGEDVDALTALDQPPAGSAAAMLDDLEDAADVSVARLARNETQAIDAAVKSRGRRRTLKTEARRIKNNYLQEDGWAPLEVAGVKENKPRFKKIAYGFENAPEGVDPLTWSSRLSDNIVSEVDGVVERARAGDEAAIGILRQANWYRSMRNQLRSEFGGIGDVFADVLGTTSAQTNVEQNFRNAVQILRRYSRGEFDAELQAYENRIKQGLPVDGKTLTALHNNGEFPLITSSSGKLFNTNSPSSMGALLNMFRSVKTGSAPKTPNFTGNLIGLTNEATIDVWAARMLRRLSGQSRIPPVAEQGVKGDHLAGSTLENPLVGSEFGFGQEVFRNAADRINASGGVRSIVPEMGDLGPDDLQAVAWFMEKERWTDAGWTTKAGEGGSLDYEMSLAGSPEQVQINSLRRELNTGFKAPKKRKRETEAEHAERVAQARRVYDNRQEFAGIELRALQAPLQRYTIGVSGEIRNRKGVPDKLMSNYEQAEFAAEYDDVVRNDPAVLGYNLANTYGSFMGATERSLNGEFVVRENFDPSALIRRMVEQGKFYDQDAVFISKSVPAGAPNARPGVEIFYKKEVTPEALAKVTESLRAHGIDGFTYITDMRFDDKVNRQARSGARETASLTGLRFQYIPEFDENFDPARAAEIYKEKEDLFARVLADTMADENVSDVRYNFYDTQVFFRDGYDEYLTRNTPAGGSQSGGEISTGAGPAQSNNGGRAGTELRQPVPDGLGQAPGSGIPQLKKGGAVTSSRRMLDALIGKKPEGQRVDASGLQRFAKGGEAASAPTSQELLAQIDRSTANSPAPAYGTASSAPDREVTESRNMLMRISDAFGKNVTAPVVGSALDMTAGVGDLLQMGAKAGAKRLGIETKPFTPVSSAIQESLGVAGYDPYSPAALAASVLLPAAGPLRAAGAATRPMMSMAAPGSAKETLSRLAPILDREASVAASAELAAMGARELAPDNVTAEIAAAIAGGGAYNTLDNILGSASRGPTTSGIIKERGGNWLAGSIEDDLAMLRNANQGLLSDTPAAKLAEMEARYTPEAMASLSPDLRSHVQSSLDSLRSRAYIDNWIDSKLGKYIRNEMATESDPIRLQADAFEGLQADRLAQKNAQIARAMENMERARLDRGVTLNEMTASQAQIRELERERALIAAQTGLHADIALLGDDGLAAHWARRESGYPMFGSGLSTMGKAWEDAADLSIRRDKAGDLLTEGESEWVTPAALARMQTDFINKNPWLSKIPPESNVYSPRQSGYPFGGLGLDHLIDELGNATAPNSDLPASLRIDPTNLNRMSVADVSKKVDEINAWRKVNRAEADAVKANNAATVPYRQYDTVPYQNKPNVKEFKWVQLARSQETPEANAALNDALEYEGSAMGHSVGGYRTRERGGSDTYGLGGWDAITNDRARIYSLRDESGKPFATIEMENEPPWISGEILNEIEPGIWNQIVADRGQYDASAWLQRNRPDILEKFNARPYLGINQIKGPGNGMPDADALPFIQDFIMSGKWSYVNDLQNTGLATRDRRTGRTPRSLQSLSTKEIDQIWDRIDGDYTTESEMLSKARELFPDKIPSDKKGFTKGGLASKSNVERVRNDNRKYL